MKSLKEIIIGQIEKGNDTINEIRVAKKIGNDFILEKNRTKSIIENYHRKSLKLEVSEIIVASKEAKIFRFTSSNGNLPVFQAGQAINIFVEINGVRTSRPYSISSSPKQRAYYEICVAKIDGGFVSDYFVDKVKVGDKFDVNGPCGHFVFNPIIHNKKMVFLAGGSGITPFMSMSREILDSGLDREINLIYGVRKEELALFHNELTEMAKKHKNFTYDLVLSEEKSSNHRTGFIDNNCILDIAKNVSDKTFFMCGPPVMINFCMNNLAKLGVPQKHRQKEAFGARQDIQNEQGWPSELTGNEVFKLKVADKIYDAKSNESVITALERAGLKPNVLCRAGGCGFCRVKLVSGKVFIPNGVLLRHTDIKFGYINSCKAYPITDLEILI